jgi:hypothetical protein
MTTSSNPSADSALKFYSLGIAAENLTIGSSMLKVTPIEKLTFVDGELKSNPTQDTVTGVDATGKSFSTNATTDSTLDAKWLPLGSNRHTPPDIRRGERLLIWRYADLDTFMWTDLGWDQNLRNLETATYVWNATQDQSDQTTTASNCYYVEVSTHKKTITLATSQANGEKCTYTIQLNPGTGTFTFADNLGQSILIDSVNQRFFVQNASKTTMLIDKQNFTITVPDTFTLSATNNVNITTKNFNLTAQNVTLTVEQNIQVNAATVQGTASQSVNIQAPTIKLGDVTISQGGNVQMGTLNASTIQCESVNATTSVTAPNLKYT